MHHIKFKYTDKKDRQIICIYRHYPRVDKQTGRKHEKERIVGLNQRTDKQMDKLFIQRHTDRQKEKKRKKELQV